MKHTSNPPTTQGEVFTRNLMAELLEDTEHRSKVVMLQFLIETFYEMRITGTTIPESQEWGLQHVTDKGFYLYPLIKKVYLVRFDNFSISLDNQQLGLGVTLDVLSLVAGESSEPAIYQAYKELREYILSHADTLEGAYTYAKLSHSLTLSNHWFRPDRRTVKQSGFFWVFGYPRDFQRKHKRFTLHTLRIYVI